MIEEECKYSSVNDDVKKKNEDANFCKLLKVM